MKKLLLLIVGFVVAFAAQAQLYVVGGDSSLGSGKLKNAITVQLKDGYYTFKAPRNSWFKMSMSNDGNWDGTSTCFNAKLIYAKNDWSESNSVKSCTASSSYQSGWADQYQFDDDYLWIRVNSTLDKIERCKDENFGATTNQTFYLIGSFNSWKSEDSNYKFSTTDGVTYTYTLSKAINQGADGWKINNGKWNEAGGIGFGPEKDKTGELNKTFNLWKSDEASNIKVGDLPAGTVITLVYSQSGTSTLLIKTKGSESTRTYFLHGQFESDTWKSVELNGEGTTYSCVYDFGATATTRDINFGIRVGDESGNQTDWYQVAKNNKVYNASVAGTQFPLYHENGDNYANLTISKGVVGKVTFTLTVGSDGMPTSLKIAGGTVEQGGGDNIPTAIYMHFKEDLEEYGKDANTKPYCHLFNADNASVGSIDKVMTLVSSRYSIWKADLTPEEYAKYNSVEFSFEKDSAHGGGSAKYYSNKFADNTEVTSFDKARWADFIYATASDNGKEFAVQSYLSYKDFTDLDQLDIDNGGRRHIYIVGWGKNDIYPLKYFDASGTEQTMPGSVVSALQVDQDGGCFYLPVLPDGGSFKISWISVADAINNLPADYDNSKKSSAREWATYDLGLIGYDKDYAYPSDTKITYNRDEGVNGKVHFVRNSSVRCMNYNQADWVLPDNTDNLPVVGRKRWIVVDTHYTEGNPDATCRTLTITSFDPNPSVKVTVESVVASPDELDDESAKNMHVDCLHGAEANGHVYMKRVNYAVGKAEVKATDLSDVKNAKFSRAYTLYVNGKKAGTTAADVTSIKIDYFPLALNKENSVSIRAKYTDSKTGLSFHSRVGNGEIDATVNFSEPVQKVLTGRYVFEREEDGMQVYGIYVEGLNCEVENNGYHVYSDFEFNLGGKAKFIDEQHYAHQVVSEIPYWKGWTPGDDWSTKMVNMQNNEQKFAPVFIHDAVKVSDFNSLPAETKVKCTIYAVYPFMYDPNATLQVNSESAPKAAPAAKAASYDGFKVFNTNVPKEVNLTVTPTGAISGVESVAADVDADAEAEYYTISGVRVIGEPAPGLYIRRQGEKVTKVVVR